MEVEWLCKYECGECVETVVFVGGNAVVVVTVGVGIFVTMDDVNLDVADPFDSVPRHLSSVEAARDPEKVRHFHTEGLVGGKAFWLVQCVCV